MSPSLAARLDEADHVEKVNLFKEPKVKQQSGFLFDYDNDSNLLTTSNGLNLGFSYEIAADLFASIESPAF